MQERPLPHGTFAEQLDRCEREIERCNSAMQDPNLTPAERRGAWQGWADWSVNRARILEELSRAQIGSDGGNESSTEERRIITSVAV